MLSEFILSRFREVGRSNDQTKNNGWYYRKYLRGEINKRMQALPSNFANIFETGIVFLPTSSTCVTLSRRRFFLFYPFLPSTFFHASWIGIDSSKSGGGSDSSGDACDRASRSHGGMRAHPLLLFYRALCPIFSKHSAQSAAFTIAL